MEMIGKVRRMHRRDKKSVREIAKATGLSRNTVAKWLQASVEDRPKYRRTLQPTKLTPFHEAIVQALEADARGEVMSRSGFEYILEKYVCLARQQCPSLTAKRVSPHVLRHSCALTVLEATKDIRKVSLWFGHASIQTTELYTRADSSIRLEALEATAAPCLRSGRFRASDKLIASLTAGNFMRRPMRAT